MKTEDNQARTVMTHLIRWRLWLLIVLVAFTLPLSEAMAIDVTFNFGIGGDVNPGAITQTYTDNTYGINTITFATTGGNPLYFAANGGVRLGGATITGMSGRVMSADITSPVNSVRISVSGKTFNLTTFNFYDFMEAGSSITLTTNKGSTTFLSTAGLVANSVDVTTNANFQGVSYVDVTSSGGAYVPIFDNVALSIKSQVQSVSVPANATYKAGDAMTFTVSYDDLVNVTGTPKLPLTLNTGGTVQASYVTGSGMQNLVFRYTVASGDLDADGVTVGSALALNGGTIRNDYYDVDAELTLYNVDATTGVKVDGVIPTISGVAPPADGTYASGQNLDFTATFTKAVTVASGTPYITLTIGGVTKHAAYTSGSGTTVLVFRYPLAPGDAGALATGTVITPNSGTIRDAVGNSATLTFTAPTTSGIWTAIATTYTWTGATSTDWGTTTNWSPNGVPGALDDIVVDKAGGAIIDLNGNQSVLNITMGNASGSDAMTIQRGSGGNLTIASGGAVSSVAGSTGSHVVSCPMPPGPVS